MKRRALVWALFLVSGTMTTAARAELQCDTPAVRIGAIKSGAPLAQHFHIVNRGPGGVEVTGMQTSCGCAVPHLEQRFLAVGESADVVLAVNTLAQGAGTRSWTLTIAYNSEGQKRELILRLAGEVVSEIRVEPTALHVLVDKAITQIVKVGDGRSKPLHITAIHATAPWIRGHLDATHPEVGVQNVQVEIGADCPEGRQVETLQLITDDPAYPELMVAVTVTRRKAGLVHASPAQIDLRDAGPGPLPPRLVRLSSGDDQDVRVERIEADHPALSCRWAAGPGPNATLRVEVDGKKVGPEGLHTMVRVHIARPTGETLEIPVVCPGR